MKRTASRKHCDNHVEIIIRASGEEQRGSLEEEIKRAIAKWNRSLGMNLSFEVISLIDRSNRRAT